LSLHHQVEHQCATLPAWEAASTIARGANIQKEQNLTEGVFCFVLLLLLFGLVLQAETSFRAGKIALGKGSGVKKANKRTLFKAFMKPATALHLCSEASSLWVGC